MQCSLYESSVGTPGDADTGVRPAGGNMDAGLGAQDVTHGDAGADLGAQEDTHGDADADAVSSALVGFARRNAASLQPRKSMSTATTAANSVANLDEIADISVAGTVA